jgi:hypothetical protein
VWDRIEENVFAKDVTNALAKIFPDDPPRFLARTPHGYHDTALIRSNEIEANGGNLEATTDHAASTIADRHGSGAAAAKIQAHVIAAAA